MRPAALTLAALSLACTGARHLEQDRAPVGPTAPPIEEGTSMAGVAGPGLGGKQVRLADVRGRWLVVYFYPIDFSSSGTAQAQEFKGDYGRYRKLGVEIVGVSSDHEGSHRDFAERYKLPFQLLADEKGEIARAFGVEVQGGATRHVTFLLDRERRIRKVWRNVRAWGHSAEVLGYIKTLPGK